MTPAVVDYLVPLAVPPHWKYFALLSTVVTQTCNGVHLSPTLLLDSGYVVVQ